MPDKSVRVITLGCSKNTVDTEHLLGLLQKDFKVFPEDSDPPYVDYLLYREEDRTVGLQNIGGIGNLTLLPAHGRPEDTLAFDTGPGNMLIDQLMERFTAGKAR